MKLNRITSARRSVFAYDHPKVMEGRAFHGFCHGTLAHLESYNILHLMPPRALFCPIYLELLISNIGFDVKEVKLELLPITSKASVLFSGVDSASLISFFAPPIHFYNRLVAVIFDLIVVILLSAGMADHRGASKDSNSNDADITGNAFERKERKPEFTKSNGHVNAGNFETPQGIPPMAETAGAGEDELAGLSSTRSRSPDDIVTISHAFSRYYFGSASVHDSDDISDGLVNHIGDTEEVPGQAGPSGQRNTSLATRDQAKTTDEPSNTTIEEDRDREPENNSPTVDEGYMKIHLSMEERICGWVGHGFVAATGNIADDGEIRGGCVIVGDDGRRYAACAGVGQDGCGIHYLCFGQRISFIPLHCSIRA